METETLSSAPPVIASNASSDLFCMKPVVFTRATCANPPSFFLPLSLPVCIHPHPPPPPPITFPFQRKHKFRGFRTRMVYLDYITCLRYTILIRTTMVYLDYITCLRYTILIRTTMVYLDYITCLRYTILIRTTMVYLDYITCLRYTILVRNPRKCKKIKIHCAEARDQGGFSGFSLFSPVTGFRRPMLVNTCHFNSAKVKAELSLCHAAELCRFSHNVSVGVENNSWTNEPTGKQILNCAFRQICL